MTWHNVQGEVLELGVGTGANRQFYPAGSHITAFDLDAERVALARKKSSPAGLCVATAHFLPFPADYFDVVVGTLVFCSIARPEQALQEVWRVLKPAGRLHLLEHVRGQGKISRWLTDNLHPLWFALQGSCHLNRETAATVQAAGFHLLYLSTHAKGIVQLLVGQKTSI
jgi:ubiquinone/menaquinone biosynthesis C-methylase UbiE